MDDPTLHLPTPVSPTQRLLSASLWLVALAASFGVAAVLLREGVWVSATAAPWLQGVDKAGSILDDGLLAWTLRHLARATGLGPSAAVRLLQLFAAGLVLLSVGRVTSRLRSRPAGAAAVAVLLLWPPARQSLQVLSVESLLALATLGSVRAWLDAAQSPLRAVVFGGVCLALLMLVHPVGLAAAALVPLALLLAPGPRAAPGAPNRSLLPARPVWLPWLATVLLAVGLVSAALPAGGIKGIWLHTLGALRTPASGLQIGWLASLPILGPLVALTGQIPLALLVLLALLTRQAPPLRERPEALVVALVLAWLVLAAAVGQPVPDSLDLLVVIAPLLGILAAVSAHDLARAAWARPGWLARAGAVSLALALVASWLGEARLGRDDRRTTLAHLPGVLDFTAPLRPAVLAPEDMALLAAHLEPTAVLPGRTGGSRVADAIKVIEPRLQTASFGPAYTTRLVLLPARPGDPVAAAFAAAGQRAYCSTGERTCLHRLRGRPDTGR